MLTWFFHFGGRFFVLTTEKDFPVGFVSCTLVSLLTIG